MPNPAPAGAVAGRITSVVLGSLASEPVREFLAQIPPACTSGWERHCLLLLPDPAFGGVALVATGSDPRGVMFAAYTIAEALLGIGPFDYWLHIDPVPSPTIDVGQLNLSFPLLVPSPAFKYRAFFVNDEDLFGGLHNDPLAESVWSVDTWNLIMTTTLRLKANAVLPGTNIFPDNPAYVLAARRGLALSSHHYNILGLSPVAQG